MNDNPGLFLDRTTPVLLTRPVRQAERFATALRARLGPVPILLSPILTIKRRAQTLDGARFHAVILTSENGVRAVASVPGLQGKVAYCVGDQTATAAGEAGLVPRSAQGAADDLVALITRDAPTGPLLFARGANSRGAVAERLIAKGLAVESHILYDQVPCPLTADTIAARAGTRPVVAPLFSPRSAALLGAAWADAQAPIVLVSLSKAVDAAWAGPPPLARFVANRPEANALLSVLAALYPDCLP